MRVGETPANGKTNGNGNGNGHANGTANGTVIGTVNGNSRATFASIMDSAPSVARGWETYTTGFLRARGVKDSFTINKITRAVQSWFEVHPPQTSSDPFEYADAVIDCFRLRPSIPIEGPIASILELLRPPVSLR